MSEWGAARLRRLAEELEESGLPLHSDSDRDALLLTEIDHALRPTVHERRAPSTGTIVQPVAEPDGWARGTQLDIDRTLVGHQSLTAARRYADGLSSWLLRRVDGNDEWALFDRPAGSERDLVVLADAFDATIVQRHPAGAVRVVGEFGLLRWDGFTWHHEPPVRTWLPSITDDTFVGDRTVLEGLLEFAVHDLGAAGIGSLLVYRPDDEPAPPVEERLAPPPPLHVGTAFHLAPLRHALAQVDGAAIFDAGGVLRQLGVRLVPSGRAEESVAPLGGTRHTAGRRYSADDPDATVVAVSENGPVSVFRNGAVLAREPVERAERREVNGRA